MSSQCLPLCEAMCQQCNFVLSNHHVQVADLIINWANECLIAQFTSVDFFMYHQCQAWPGLTAQHIISARQLQWHPDCLCRKRFWTASMPAMKTYGVQCLRWQRGFQPSPVRAWYGTSSSTSTLTIWTAIGSNVSIIIIMLPRVSIVVVFLLSILVCSMSGLC